MTIFNTTSPVCKRCAILFHRPRCRRRSLNEFPAVCQRRDNSNVVHAAKPFRMAVIGSGPAGFYTAYKVMSKIENAIVDMYERLPVPFGLVRFGVAPDHPEVKVCYMSERHLSVLLPFTQLDKIAMLTLLSYSPTELPRQVHRGRNVSGFQLYRKHRCWQRSAFVTSNATLRCHPVCLRCLERSNAGGAR